jgi:uncharacterized protein
MEPTQKLLLLGLAFSVPLGALINKTNFCTMGGISDWINFGNRGRLFAWLFAVAVAILSVSIMEARDVLSVEKTIPPYLTANFAWPRYLLGGFLFGIGMTLGGGCLNKTLINIGRGSLKSLLVALVAAVMAYLMTKTDFYGVMFHSWISPLTIDLSQYQLNNQSLPALLARVAGMESAAGTLTLVTGLVLSGLIALWVFGAKEFRSNPNDWIAGLALGLAVAAGWYLTGGPLGKEVLEAVEWMDQRPVGVGVQSLTFVNPMGEFLAFGMAPSQLLITFGMTCAAGLVIGSLLYAVISRTFHVQGFASVKDTVRHVIGGILMGIGGVLGMGCTIGQGVTGVSTLSLGSMMVFTSIVFGSVLTMKIEYYRMMYEGQAFFRAVLPSVLVDMHLLPQAMRKLERP